MSNTTQDLSDTVWPPSYANPNVPALDMNGNLYGLTSLSTAAFTLNGASMGSQEVNYINGITAGTAASGKAIVLDSNRSIQNVGSIAISSTINDSISITNTSSTGRSNIKFINDSRNYECGVRASNASDPKNGFYISDSTSGYRLVIASNGNASIGGSAIIAPSKTLSVNGDINAISEYYRNDVLIFSSALTGVSDVSGAVASKALILDSGKAISGITSLTSTNLNCTTATASTYKSGADTIFVSALTNVSDVSGAVASKAVILDASKSIAGITSITSSGIAISGTTASTSSTTGALTVAGGVGIAGTLCGGGGTTNFSSTARSESVLNYAPMTVNNNFNPTDNTARYTYYLGNATMTATTSTVTASAATMYIAGAPIAGTNQTITNPYALIINSGRTQMGGDRTYSVSQGTENILTIPTTTYTASGISSSDTNHRSTVSIGAQTFTSSSSITTTNASTVYISGAPAQAGSMTITNAYAMYINSGDLYVGGKAIVKSSLSVLPGTIPTYDSTRLAQFIDSTQSGGTTRYITLGKAYATNDACALSYNWTSGGSNSNYAALGLYGSSAFNNTLVISGNGNVGIGTTNPSYNLDVTGTLRSTGAATFSSTIATTAGATIGGTLTVNGTGPHVFAGSVTATLTSGAQTGITSVGTLSSLAVTGSVSIGASTITPTLAGYLANATTTNSNSSSLLMCDASKNLGGINNISGNSFYSTGTQISYLTSDLAATEAIVYIKTNTMDNSSAAGTDNIHRALMYIRSPTLNSTNAITTTTASTVRIEGPPTSSGNQTLTNRFALYANGPVFSSGVSSYVYNTNFERVQQWTSDAGSPIMVEMYVDSRNRSTSTYSAQLGTTTANEFALITSNTRRLYITSGGDTFVTNKLTVGTSVTTPCVMVGTSTDSTRLISALDSSMVATNLRYITLGRDTDPNNQAELSFYFAGLGSTSNQLRFGYAGNHVMYMGFNNRIGIMNSSPSRELDVTGTIGASNGFFISATQVIDGSRNGSFNNIAGTLTTATQTGITSLGVLTSLAVSSAAADNLTVTNSSTTASASILFTNDSTRSVSFGLKGSAVSGASNYIYIYDNNAGSYRLAIDTSGRVGLGTSTPQCTLDLGTVGVSGTDQLLCAWSNGSAFYGWGANGTLLKHQSASGHAFYTGSTRGGVGTEQMRITTTGVGIGTATTTRLLEVNGSFNCSSFYIGGTQVTSTASKLNYVDITTAGTAQASKAIVLDASSNISGINAITNTGNIATNTSSITSYLLMGNSVDTARVISALFSLSSASRKSILCFGKTNSLNNQAEINYYHTADGSSSNRMEIGCYGTTSILTIQFNSMVGINNLTPAYAMDVTGDINATATIKIGGTTAIDASRNGAFNNIAGTLTTATQSNVTQIGTLTQLKVNSEQYIKDTYGITFTSDLSTTPKRARISGDGVGPSLIFDANVTGGYVQFFTKKGSTLKCFEINDSGSANNALSIYADNKIGINKASSTSALTYYLDVNGSANATSYYLNGSYIVDASSNARFADLINTRLICDVSTINYADNSGTSSESCFKVSTRTYNNSTGIGVDSNHRAGIYIATPVFTATNTGVSTTTAASLYVAGVPTSGTNNTIANAWAIYAAGQCLLNGILSTSSTDSTSTSTGSIIAQGGMGVAKTIYAGTGIKTLAGDIVIDDGNKFLLARNVTSSDINCYIASENTSSMLLASPRGDGYIKLSTNNATGKQFFLNDSNSSSNDAIAAYPTNCIGINQPTGTTSISYNLAVNGTASVSGDVVFGHRISFTGTFGDLSIDNTVISERLYGGTESSEMLLFKGNDPDATNGPDRIRFRAAEFRFQTYTSPETYATLGDNNNRVVINNTGFVGIGTTNPLFPLHVDISQNDTVSHTFAYYNASNASGIFTGIAGSISIYANGRVYCKGEIDIESDKRVKMNIEALKDEYCDRLLNVKPCIYTKKTTGNVEIGFIAQDLLKHGVTDVVNADVMLDDDHNYLVDMIEDGIISHAGIVYNVNYIGIIPILLNLVKRNRSKQELLETRVKQLEQDNTDIKRQLSHVLQRLQALEEKNTQW